MRLAVDIIAAEQLICALAAHAGLYLLRCGFCDEIKCNGRGIRQRLVHVILHGGDGIPVFLFGNQLAVVINFDFFGQCLCIVDFVIFFVIKADGKGLVSMEAGSNIGAVHAAGKEGADLDIRNLMRLDGILHSCIDFIHIFLQRFAVVCLKHRLPIAFDIHFAVLEGEAMRRHQLENAFEEGFLQNAVLEGQIIFQCNGIDLFFDIGVRQNCLDFGCVNQIAVGNGVIKGLDAEKVSCAEDGFIFLIPDNEGKHPAQLLQKFLAPFLVAVNQHLGIGAAAHDMSLGF